MLSSRVQGVRRLCTVGARTLYDVLGVDKAASQEDIRRAFRIKAKRLHPDLDASHHSPEDFVEVVLAYEVLRNPATRQQYDARAPAPGRRVGKRARGRRASARAADGQVDDEEGEEIEGVVYEDPLARAVAARAKNQPAGNVWRAVLHSFQGPRFEPRSAADFPYAFELEARTDTYASPNVVEMVVGRTQLGAVSMGSGGEDLEEPATEDSPLKLLTHAANAGLDKLAAGDSAGAVVLNRLLKKRAGVGEEAPMVPPSPPSDSIERRPWWDGGRDISLAAALTFEYGGGVAASAVMAPWGGGSDRDVVEHNMYASPTCPIITVLAMDVTSGASAPIAHVLPPRSHGAVTIRPIVSLNLVVPVPDGEATPPVTRDRGPAIAHPFNASDPLEHIGGGADTVTTFSSDAGTFRRVGRGEGAPLGVPPPDSPSWAAEEWATHSLVTYHTPMVQHARWVLNATGFPEAKGTRSWAPDPNAWLWRPRSDAHCGGSMYIEVARRPRVSTGLHPSVYVLTGAVLALEQEFEEALGGRVERAAAKAARWWKGAFM